MKQQLIKGTARLVALLGNPVKHSLSPIFQNHAFSTQDLPFVYIPLAVEKQDLHSAMRALRTLNFAGANITIPYKSAVLPYCDTLSEISKLTGTVNTLYTHNGLFAGTTTDADGFFRALAYDGQNIENAHVVILGNGGTARTLGFAIATQTQTASLSIIGRSKERVENLASEISEKTGVEIVTALFDSKQCKFSLNKCTLLINCTSVGLAPNSRNSPLPQDVFHKEMYVFDTIYNPAETRLQSFAKKAGCKTQNGLRMLLYQGFASFRLWTGVDADESQFDLGELQSFIT